MRARAVAPLVLATALLVAAATIGAGSASSQTAPSPATGASGGVGTMVLRAQSPWVAPVGSFDLQVDAGSVPPDAQIVARIYVPISTQDQLDRVARGQSLGQRVESVSVPAGAVGRASDGSLQLSYTMVANGNRAATGFLLANPGVYPFSLEVVSADGHTLSQLMTQLVRLPAAPAGSSSSSSSASVAPLTVALTVPYGAPVSHHPNRAATLSASTLAALQGEAAALAQYPDVPLSVTPVPETIDTLANHDRTTGTHLVSTLRAAVAHRPLLSGTYVPVDSGAWVAHGLTDGYDAQLQAGDQALTQVSPGVVNTAAVLDTFTSPESLGRLMAHGSRVVVVPSNRLAAVTTRSSGTGTGPLTQWFELSAVDGGHVSAIPADATLDGALATGTDPVLAAHRVLSALALVSLDRSGSQACVRQVGQPCRRGLAIALPANAGRDQAILPALLAALASPTAGGDATPLVQAAAVTDFTGTVDPSSASDRTTTTGAPTLRRLDAAAVASLGAYPTRFHAVTADIASFRGMAAGPTGPGAPPGKAADLANSWQQMALASGSTQLTAVQRDAYLTDIQADLQGQLSQITAIGQQTVTLTSAAGKIPFSISNALDYPVRVGLNFQSPKLHFVNGNEQVVTIPAGQPAHLTIPVTVRASGAFPMQVTITSPDHGLAITHTRFDVRSTAISSIGLILTVAAGLFLALWWIRHARDSRRRRSLVTSGHPVLQP